MVETPEQRARTEMERLLEAAGWLVKDFFADATNQLLCKTFLENALRDPVSGEIGKSIVFAVSQNHAAKLAQILKAMSLARSAKDIEICLSFDVETLVDNVGIASIRELHDALGVGYAAHDAQVRA